MVDKENNDNTKTEISETVPADASSVSGSAPDIPAGMSAGSGLSAESPGSGSSAGPDTEKPLGIPIHQVLKEKNQLSISGIARELKDQGFDEHRLVVTGYLRALRDIGDLAEINILPSKIYMLKNGTSDHIFDRSASFPGTTDERDAPGLSLSLPGDDVSGASSDISAGSLSSPSVPAPDSRHVPSPPENRNIYARLKSRISGIGDKKTRFEVAVYVMCSLFDRPCFEYELSSVGCDIDQISGYFEKTESGNDDLSVRKLKSDRQDIRKTAAELKIPKGNAAFESGQNIPRDILLQADQITFSLLKEELDLSGLVLKQTTKNIFDF